MTTAVVESRPLLTRGGVIVAGPVPTRVGMVEAPQCYGCLGTGFVVGFGHRAGRTPCLHHVVDCDPDSCAPGCEHRAALDA